MGLILECSGCIIQRLDRITILSAGWDTNDFGWFVNEVLSFSVVFQLGTTSMYGTTQHGTTLYWYIDNTKLDENRS